MTSVNLCEPEEGKFNVWNQSFAAGDTGTTAVFRFSFPHACEVAQPNFISKDSAADCAHRTLSRIDRVCTNPVAEARGFHIFSFSDNLGDWTIASDHVAVRVVVEKPIVRRDQVKRIRSAQF